VTPGVLPTSFKPGLGIPTGVAIDFNGDSIVASRSSGLLRVPLIGLTTTIASVDTTALVRPTGVAVEQPLLQDTTPPVLTVPANLTVECSSPTGQAVNIGQATATDIVDPNPTITNNAPALFFLGATTVTWTATDASGNTATATQTVTVQDTISPGLTAPANLTVEASGPGGQSVNIGSATATDICDPSVVITNDAPATFPLGTTTVTWTATDASGNTATATQTITVQDTISPSITVPANLTVECSSPTGQAVNIGQATATDLTDPNPIITNDAPALFNLGTTTVTWTATDTFGNSASAAQLVTVEDTTPPSITVPADAIVEATALNTPLSDVPLGTATATDICDPSVVITNDAPATFPLGDTTVTWTATDASGNSATATQTITLQDTTPPVLTVPADVTVECNSPNGAIDVELGVATAVDLVDSNPSITNDAPSFFPLGTTIVTYTATDFSGNSASATQEVTVVDTTPPSVMAALVPVIDDDDEGLFRVEFSVTDICDENPVVTANINGIPVTNGQLVELEIDDETEVEEEDGILEIEAPIITLTVEATDASGNTGTATAVPLFVDDDDEDDEDDEDDDD